MKAIFKAIYRNGQLHPTGVVPIPANAEVEVEATWHPGTPPDREMRGADLEQYIGTIGTWPVDPVEWQRELRDDGL